MPLRSVRVVLSSVRSKDLEPSDVECLAKSGLFRHVEGFLELRLGLFEEVYGIERFQRLIELAWIWQ